MAFSISYSFQHKRKKFSYCGWPLLNTEALNKQCKSMLKRYHVKLILYQRPCNTEGTVFMDSCKVLMFEMKIVSVNSKHYHPWQPWHKSSKSGKSWPSFQIFLSNVQPPDFPGSLNFDKFYTFPPLSRSQSLGYLQICMVNIYLLIENM